MTIRIDATKREGTPEEIRAAGRIPAVVYGPDTDATSVSVDALLFEKMYAAAGDSTLVDFSLDGGEATKVLVQDIQTHPLKHTPIHVDFRQIKMGEEMSVSIALEFIGDAEAVKLGGTLVTGIESVNVKCLPKDLVSSLEVSLEALKTFEDKITLADIAVPAGITFMDDPHTVLASVTAPLTEDQLKAMEEENSKGVESVEVDEKEAPAEEAAEEKKDGEEKSA